MALGLKFITVLLISIGYSMSFAAALSFVPPRTVGPAWTIISKRVYSATKLGDFSFRGSRTEAWCGAASSPGHRQQAWRHTSATPSMIAPGDMATVDYYLRTGDGTPFEARFDQGCVKLVVGGGGFAPFVHEAVLDMEQGQAKVINIPPKDAFGEYDPEMTATLGIESAPTGLKAGMVVQLWNGMKAKVTDVTGKDFKLDWNPSDSGTSLVMDIKVLGVVNADSVLQKATFAGGCFWGLELAFQRAKGVVSTKVGYAQGTVQNPTYSEVCGGKTGHTEAVQTDVTNLHTVVGTWMLHGREAPVAVEMRTLMKGLITCIHKVLYDPSETSFEKLLDIFFGRHDPLQADGQGNDKGPQYRAGVYYHDDEQREVAEAVFAKEQGKHGPKNIMTELEEVKVFYDAEEHHQQYLQKGGQDARKAATETIRCYG